MGELEEKETPPTEPQSHEHHPEAEEPKETDKMLEQKLTSTTDDKRRSPTPEKDKKTPNGEEIINIPEAAAAAAAGAPPTGGDDKKTTNNSSNDTENSKPNPVTKEGREVKPKKIPIGGIKMPGFFMKAKPRGDGDGAEGELLEKEPKETSPTIEEKPIKSDDKQRPGLGDRIRSFFVRKPKPSADDTAKSDLTAEAADENNGPPQKRGLLNAIKLPIANMIPKKKTDDDVELGNGPGTKAGLASMETLDDSLKDQDTVDKAPTKKDDDVNKAKGSQEIKTEKCEEEEEVISCFDRIRSYRCSVDDALITLGILLIVVMLIVIGYVLSSGSQTSPQIREGRYIDAVTGCGMVEGLKEDGAFAFRGIPYALPPTGENRFRPAKLIEDIDDCWNGTLKAHNATEVCTQMLGNSTIVGIEDCLTLDVITPHIRYDNPLPVVVLIGADSFTGGSPGILRPSARYARSHDVIFVRPNFRLGVFGFLALDVLTKEAYPRTSGNYGLTDIVAALKWINLNIAHFGGDPKSVTLFGYRAGATMVSALVTSSKIKHLYTRAWVTSGSAVFPGRGLMESERRNVDFLNQMQCSDIKCLQEATTTQIWQATPDTWLHFPADLPAKDENATARHEWLVLDGNLLHQHPADIWKEQTSDKPKLVIGTTAHESHTEKLRMRHTNWTQEEVRAYIEDTKIGALNLTDEAIQRYNATYQGLVAMISDIRTICPLLINARVQTTVPFYVATQGEGPDGLAKIDVDVQAILGRYEPLTVEQRRYVSSMQQLFYYYVSHGAVPQYNPSKRVLNMGQDPLPQEDYPNCNFWISHDIVPRHARID